MDVPPVLFERQDLFTAAIDVRDIVDLARTRLTSLGFLIRRVDRQKPWGAEIKLRGSQERAEKFLRKLFDGLPIVETLSNPVTPKILLIKDACRLSWHVHARKDAHLRVLHGNVGVSMSETDAEPAPTARSPGAYVHVPPNMRHRLSSLSGWSVIAEIGRDVDPEHPSDDRDTRRIQDDYGR